MKCTVTWCILRVEPPFQTPPREAWWLTPMADGYHSKEPIVSNCAIILLLDDMRVSYLFVVYNQSLERVSLDKVVVGVLVAILTEVIAKKICF